MCCSQFHYCRKIGRQTRVSLPAALFGHTRIGSQLVKHWCLNHHWVFFIILKFLWSLWVSLKSANSVQVDSNSGWNIKSDNFIVWPFCDQNWHGHHDAHGCPPPLIWWNGPNWWNPANEHTRMRYRCVYNRNHYLFGFRRTPDTTLTTPTSNPTEPLPQPPWPMWWCPCCTNWTETWENLIQDRSSEWQSTCDWCKCRLMCWYCVDRFTEWKILLMGTVDMTKCKTIPWIGRFLWLMLIIFEQLVCTQRNDQLSEWCNCRMWNWQMKQCDNVTWGLRLNSLVIIIYRFSVFLRSEYQYSPLPPLLGFPLQLHDICLTTVLQEQICKRCKP